MKDPLRLTLLVALLLSLPLAAFAGNFGLPSNPAGIWEMTIEPGTSLISFPVLPAQANPGTILGDHFPGGVDWESSSRIMTYEDGLFLGAYFNSDSSAWIGTLDTLKLERAYWIIVPDDAEPLDLRLVGGAMTMEQHVVDVLESGVHAVACPAIVPMTLAGSGLTQSGWTSNEFRPRADRIYSWTGPDPGEGLQISWHDPAQGWVGVPFTFEPGKGYLLERLAGRTPMPWTRPKLTVGAQPPAVIDPTPIEAPALLSLPLDVDTAPWELEAAAETRMQATSQPADTNEPGQRRNGGRVVR